MTTRRHFTNHTSLADLRQAIGNPLCKALLADEPSRVTFYEAAVFARRITGTAANGKMVFVTLLTDESGQKFGAAECFWHPART